MNQVKRALVMAGAALFGAVCFASFPTVTHAESTVSPPTVRATEPLGQTSEVSQDISSGEVGTVRWSIEDGTLKLSGGEIPTTSQGPAVSYPWSSDALYPLVTSVDIEGPIKLNGNAPVDFFFKLVNATNIKNLSDLDTSDATDMDSMFEDDNSLTSIDLSNFKTNKVISMDSMFSGDSALKSIDVSKFDTSQVKNMIEMFSLDSSLTTLDVSNFDTSLVNNMADMFSDETNITSICLGRFDTHSVTDMDSMFYADPNLKAINVSHFDTSKVTSMDSMFNEDESLSSLDLSSFDMANVEEGYLENMLAGTTNLTRLVLGPKVRLEEGVGLESPKGADNWQAVGIAGNGTIEHPLGGIYNPEELIEEYAEAGIAKELYVPENGFTDQSTINVPSSITLSLGAKFDATDHFISAVTPEGRTVTKYCDAAAEGLVIDGGNIDTSKPGTYTVTYHFYGSDHKATMTVIIPAPGTGGGGSVTPTPTPVTPAPQPTPTPSPAPTPTEPTKPTTPNVPNYAATKRAAVYALKTICLYRNPTFKKSQRIARYPKQKRINRPMFVVIDYARSNGGALRYKVRDVNHNSKTDGKIGYITAKWSHVRPVYYRSMPKGNVITVISKKGVHAYKNKNLTGRVKTYKKGTHLSVKNLVKHNLTTRYVLSNGYHVTANKKLVIQGKY